MIYLKIMIKNLIYIKNKKGIKYKKNQKLTFKKILFQVVFEKTMKLFKKTYLSNT